MSRHVSRVAVPLVLATLAVATLAQPVLSAGPTRTRIDLNDPAIDARESAGATAACGFQVTASIKGQWTLRTYPAGSSGRRPSTLNTFATVGSYTAVATGVTVRYRDVGSARTYTVDGRRVTAYAGRLTSVTGTIGRVVYDVRTNAVTFQAGRVVGRFYDTLCARLRDVTPGSATAAARPIRAADPAVATAAEREARAGTRAAAKAERVAERTTAGAGAGH